QLASYTDCSGHTSRWLHDAFGELIEETDALGQRIRHQRDAMGRLQQTAQADGTLVQYRWGDNQQVQAITLGALASPGPSSPSTSVQTTTITYGHDLWGRVNAQTQAGASLHLRYDVAGRLTELVNENHAVTRFAYDSEDRLVRETGFDGRIQSYRYDAAGQLIEKTDAQDSGMGAPSQSPGESQGTVRSRYHYDSAGRLIYRVTGKLGRAGATAETKSAKPTTPFNADTDLQIHRFGYSDSGELKDTQGSQLDWPDQAGQSDTTSAAVIAAWLEINTQQLHSALSQQHDAQTLASSPLLQSLQVHRLHKSSRVDLQRDALGRPTGEVQTLYCSSSGAPAIEFEHRIHHRLGALGQRETSELQ
ncbi:MAG: RHS repeat protein, partial [Comamonadaceae bacterium]